MSPEHYNEAEAKIVISIHTRLGSPSASTAPQWAGFSDT
jgi:hypothetical protein